MDEKTLSEIEGRDGSVPARLAEAGYGVVYEDRRALLAEVRRLRAEVESLQAALNEANAHAVELRAEAEDLALHHTCDGCGAPRLQGPCSKHCDRDE